jgi:hypothetical protein
MWRMSETEQPPGRRRVVLRPVGPRSKLFRGVQHAAELERLTREVYEHIQIEVRDNRATGQREWWTSCDAMFTRQVALVAGDAIHNLRAALDLMYCELVRAAGNTIADYDTFPFRKSARAFEDTVPAIGKRIAGGALEALRELEPFKGGNEPLYLLHRLDIIDKHRLLTATVVSARGGITRGELPTLHLLPDTESVALGPRKALAFVMPLDDPEVDEIGGPFIELFINEPEAGAVQLFDPLLRELQQAANRAVRALSPFCPQRRASRQEPRDVPTVPAPVATVRARLGSALQMLRPSPRILPST